MSEQTLAILTGYFDESYSHAPQPLVYTIAGYISEDWRWRRFETEWLKTLGAEGIEYFHMIDFAHKKGVYKDWTEKQRRKFLKKLHYIIHSNTMIDFAVSVVVADYDEMIPPANTQLRIGFGEPHVFAVIGCMKSIHAWAKATYLRDRINYVFEQGTIHDVTVQRVFGSLDDAHNEHYRSTGCTLHNKRDRSPLQAADTLAYENMLEMRRKIDPANTRPTRASAKNLERPVSHWIYYDKAQLTKVIDAGFESGLLVIDAPSATDR